MINNDPVPAVLYSSDARSGALQQRQGGIRARAGTSKPGKAGRSLSSAQRQRGAACHAEAAVQGEVKSSSSKAGVSAPLQQPRRIRILRSGATSSAELASESARNTTVPLPPQPPHGG